MSAAAIVLVLLIAAGAFAYVKLPVHARSAAEAAVADLRSGSLDSSVWTDAGASQKLHDTVVENLGEHLVDTRGVELTGIDTEGDATVALLHWTWTNEDDETWEYDARLPLERNGLLWSAALTEAALHPELEPGGVLETRSTPTARGSILGADGESLVADGTVIDVGVRPSGVEESTVKALEKELDIDGEALTTRIDAAEPDHFVPVITLREDDYEAVKDAIHDLPGTVFATRTQPLNRTKGFAAATLGTAGRASAEDIEASGGELTPETIVGRSGLQKTFDEQLRGPANEQILATGGDGEPVLLHEFPGRDGEDLETTLDVTVQEAADAAAATARKPAALVAIRPSDGHIVAVANHDPDAAAWDRALTGQYPPGSVFKVASALAMLDSGISPSTMVDCPKTTTVDGKSFKNAEDHVLGEVAFEENFAESCNTAFVDAAQKVSSADVANAAMNLGMGEYDLGVGSTMSEVPIDDDPVLHAAQMIGQGNVVSSPLAVAVMAASVANGDSVSPLLVLPDERTELDERVLEPGSIEDLQSMMRRAVTDGTANALDDVPGEPVHGKTGTAEYGSESPPRTHSWFAGYQGDMAVAVLVEDGGFGADAAVPVAEEFFTALG
ncbi:cell division protein FtsI/penicillin-binding protein 2 [Brevibacterium sanguinis]|uniref:Cell division protein FtsI/penicillin-binding protein 2 n=2 Tax=Brevibacterium TaxID=1696 RepID=A0A366INR7_9MICO|nr:cell division protein FtsI/penicillin-binding protein 2 [Brevibacterium sanguinis]RBP73644.1 cell division protein FtsI/penicillin-binding protein 2 [Brevibacterium celere]